ncbi:outer membrane protein assembly factor BamB, partial [Cycloclasticus sp. 44_32_T64]
MIRLGLALFVVALVGCAGMAETTKSASKSLESGIIDMMSASNEDESAPPQPLEEIVNEVVLTPVWQEKVTEGKGDQFLKLEMVLS